MVQVSTHLLNFLVDARNSTKACVEGSSKHPIVPELSLVGKKEASINRPHRKETMVKDYNMGSNSLFWRGRRRLREILFLIFRVLTKQ